MNRMKLAAAASVLTLASVAVMPARADVWNKKTIITISDAVQVPGAILQPGKYVMKLLDSQSNRHIVQIFNEREDQLQTTILAIPNYRLQPTGKTEFQWWETPAGQPKAMRAWFYPGDNFGQEFAYPKSTAVQIAQATNEVVPSVSGEDLSKATVSSVDKTGNESELNKETYTAQTPAPEPAPEVAQNTPPAPAPQAVEPAPAPEATRARTEERLPTTASPIPLAALAGFLALGAGVAVRAVAKRA
jgi:hypothetical protein